MSKSEAQLTAEFLARGGRIKQVQQGAGLNLSGKAWKALAQGEQPPESAQRRIERAAERAAEQHHQALYTRQLGGA